MNEKEKVGVPPSYPYISPCSNEFPIICWGCFDLLKEEELWNKGNLRNYENFVKAEISNITECGFNVAIRDMKAEDYKRFSPYLSGSGLNLIGTVSKYYANRPTECKQFVEKIKQNGINLDYLKAWMVGEEPEYDQLETWGQSYSAIRSIFPNLMTFLTLSASEGGKNVGFVTDDDDQPTEIPNSYSSYLLTLRTIFRPAVWCYDLYPIRHTSPESEEVYVAKGFYRFFEIFSKISKETRVPFWAFCQCLQVFFKDSNLPLGRPTISRMRFEAFSALAYGAQGILYWSFLDRMPSDKETYANGPIDLNFQRTNTWEYVKQVNSEIKQFSEIFLGATMIECKHTTNLPSDNKPWTGISYINGSIGPIVNIKASGDGVLVSLLENNNKTYFMIVSHDPDKEVTVTISLDMTYSYQVPLLPVAPFEPIIPTSDSNNDATKQSIIPVMSVNRTLSPGGYLIYQYYKKVSGQTK